MTYMHNNHNKAALKIALACGVLIWLASLATEATAPRVPVITQRTDNSTVERIIDPQFRVVCYKVNHNNYNSPIACVKY